MKFSHAPDWSWVSGSCSACGYRVKWEIIPEGQRALRVTKGPLGVHARGMQADLEDKLKYEFSSRGCTHT